MTHHMLFVPAFMWRGRAAVASVTLAMVIALGSALPQQAHAASATDANATANANATNAGNARAQAAAALFDRGVTPRSGGDEIVAVVGNDIITRNELEHRVNINQRELESRGTNPGDRAALMRETLNALVNERILVQYAKRGGISVDDADVDAALAQIAQASGESVEQLLQKVQADGLTPSQFREGIRNEGYLARLREMQANQIKISEAEIEQFITERGGGASNEVGLAQIFVALPANASEAEVQAKTKRMNEAQTKLRAGSSFEEVARQYSEAAESSNGGLLGYRAMDKFPQIFQQAVQGLKPGETSAVIRSPAGLHLLKFLGAKSQAAKVVLPQVRARRIVLGGAGLRDRDAALKRLSDIKHKVEDGSLPFSEAARNVSQDTTTARKGGDMGWQVQARLEPEVEQALAPLAPGQLSEPLVQGANVVLYQLLERNERELDRTQMRDIAMQQLRNRKREQALENLLREIKPSFYVELRE